MKKLKKLLFICIFMYSIFNFTNNQLFAEKFTLCEGFSYKDISPELKNFMNNNSFKIHSFSGKENDWVRFEDLRYLGSAKIDRERGKLITR